MREIGTKIIVVFLAIVFISVLVNHGAIDFTLWDKTVETTKDAVNSEQGQELISETKDTSFNVAKAFVDYFSSSSKDVAQKAKIKKNSLTQANVTKIVDGDTLIVEIDGDSSYVRFIGMDTPESVNPDAEKNTVWGSLASEHTKSLLSGKDTVYLQYDTERFDKYGRLLAYVWLTDEVDVSSKQDIANNMLNGIIIRDGYAVDKQYPPNLLYADVFRELCEEAESMKAGLWADNDFASLWD